MPKELTAPSFDYSTLSKDAKGKLICLAGEIRKQSKSHASSGLELGRLFSESKGLLGESFKTWVERESWHSVRSAYNYISAWENFGDCANLHNIELSAMYELAKSETAKRKALKLAERGVKVTHSVAKELVEEASDSEPKTTRRAADSGSGDGPSQPAKVSPRGEWHVNGETPESAATETGEDERTDSPGKTPQEPSPAPPRNGTEHRGAIDYGKCPNCASTKWTRDEFGVACAKCHHPHGVETGGADEDRIGTQRQKTVKTVEALMRAFDDLNMLLARSEHVEAIASCKFLLKCAKAWK